MTATKVNWMALRRAYYLANEERMSKMTLDDVISEMATKGFVPRLEDEPWNIQDDYTDCYIGNK